MPAAMTASVLCAPLLDGEPQALFTVARSRHALQLADRSGRVRMCLCDARAVRLPHGVTLPELPGDITTVQVGRGSLPVGGSTYRVTRWRRPARPHLPVLRDALSERGTVQLLRSWPKLLGRGGGLTPYGDDILCGALVALRAAGAPAASLLSQRLTAARLEQRTTAVSAALLRLAADGWCIDQLAAYLHAQAAGVEISAARAALLEVGGSSGRGLLQGVHLVYDVSAAAAA